MFAALARFDVRFRWLIVAVWIAGAIAGARLLPTLASVTSNSNTQFLSASAPSMQAARLAAPFQGNSSPSATAIIVATSTPRLLSTADNAAIGRALRAARSVPGVTLVRAPVTAKDGQAAQALVTVTPTVASSNSKATTVVDAIRGTFAGAPPGLVFHLTGQLAVNVDASNTHSGNIQRFTFLFVIVLLFVVYRALLAPLATLIPALLSLVLAQGLIAEAAKGGLSVAGIDQQLLIVLLLGAGTDYGLFLAFRVREEIAAGAGSRAAVVTAMTRVGEAISYSALTVAAALLTLLLASFGIYRSLGPALAIGIGVLLLSFLTLTPALLAIFGRAAFWPSLRGRHGDRPMLWGRVAERAVRRPALTLAVGIIVLGALAAGLAGYRTGGLTSSAPAGSDSAAGQTELAAHFPKATTGADQLLLRYRAPVWRDPAVLSHAQARLAAGTEFVSINGPLGPGRGTIDATQLARLHAQLGPPTALAGHVSPPLGVSAAEYQAYKATAQFISADGRTLQYYTVLRAGPVGSTSAAGAIPAARAALASAAAGTGATASGVAGQDASAHDISAASSTSLAEVVPVVLVLILVLLGLLLRSLVAPWYLAATVGLSYLASLGFAMIIFVHLGGSDGLIFALPLLMFVFSMALGEDYNILVMSRIKEEAEEQSDLRAALTHAVGITGGTITSAGIILAGTFTVLGLAGGSSQAQQLGFSIAFGIVLDTFFVRTLLVPSLAMMTGRWNWWPSRLARHPAKPDAAAR